LPEVGVGVLGVERGLLEGPRQDIAYTGPTTRRLVIYVETERALGADEETYSCTLTIPDDALAKVSA